MLDDVELDKPRSALEFEADALDDVELVRLDVASEFDADDESLAFEAASDEELSDSSVFTISMPIR